MSTNVDELTDEQKLFREMFGGWASPPTEHSKGLYTLGTRKSWIYVNKEQLVDIYNAIDKLLKPQSSE